MADRKKRQELISKAAQEELTIRLANEESLKQQKEDLKDMARLGQQMTATQKKAYDALVKAEKKEEEIKKKKEKQLKIEEKKKAQAEKVKQLNADHARDLSELGKLQQKNNKFESNAFGFATKVNKLAQNNLSVLNAQNKQNKLSEGLGEKLRQVTKDIASGNLDTVGLKDQQALLEEELANKQDLLSKGKQGVKKADIDAIENAINLNQIEQARLGLQTSINTALSTADGLFGNMGSTIKGFLLNPLTASLALIALITHSIQEVGDEFGAVGVNKFKTDLMGVKEEFVKVGLETKEALSTSRELSETFGIAFTDSMKLAGSVADIAKSTGLATTDSAKLVGLFTEIGGLSEQGAVELAKQAESLATASGVAPNTILKDIADNTETFAKFSGTGAQGLARAAIQARKLGVEFQDIANAAEGILDFESSLNAEVEASVMLGRQVNLQKARELSLAGDLEGFQREILKQVGSQAEFDKMNVLQKKALATATGLTVEQLSKMVSKEKEAVTLAGSLNKQKIEDIVPAATIDAFAQVLNEMKAVGIQLATVLGPVFVGFGKVLAPIIEFLNQFHLITAAVIVGLGKMAVSSAAATKATLIQSLVTQGLVTAKKAENMTMTQAIVLRATETAKIMKNAGVAVFGAIAQAGLGAAKIAAKIPVAGFIIGGALLSAFIAYLMSSLSAAPAGDMFSPAGGSTMISTKEGGLFEMSKNDDILAGPGIAAAVGGGGATVINTDTSGMEKQAAQTNTKLDELISVMIDQPKQTARRIGGKFNEAKTA